MRKSIIALFVFFILCGVVFYDKYYSWKPFRCDSHIVTQIIMGNNDYIELNVNVNIIVTSQDKAEISTIGSFKAKDKIYTASRSWLVSTKPSEFKNVEKVIITSEQRRPIDNVPDELWKKAILPAAIGVGFFSEKRVLANNALLINGISSPYVICAIHKN